MWDQERFKAALDFAAKAHGNQTVPGTGFPYVVHVVKVATEVLRAAFETPGIDATLAMTCALLHDTVEDAGVTEQALREAFGDDVAKGVSALTKNAALAKEERMADSLARVHALGREVWLVKLADRVTNLEPPPPDWSRDKRRAYLSEARVILDTLRGASGPLEARLEKKIAEYHAFCH